MQAQKKETEICQEIRFSEERSFQHKTLEERATEFGSKLNLDGEYDWGIPVGKRDVVRVTVIENEEGLL